MSVESVLAGIETLTDDERETIIAASVVANKVQEDILVQLVEIVRLLKFGEPDC